jgi:hypothetical protein
MVFLDPFHQSLIQVRHDCRAECLRDYVVFRAAIAGASRRQVASGRLSLKAAG